MKPDKITKVYLEDRDCGANPNLPEYNTLKLKTVDNYLVIETARWALDETTVEDFFLEIRSMLKAQDGSKETYHDPSWVT